MKPLEYAKIKLKPVAKVSAFFNFAVGDDIEFVSRSKRIETIGVKKDCNTGISLLGKELAKMRLLLFPLSCKILSNRAEVFLIFAKNVPILGIPQSGGLYALLSLRKRPKVDLLHAK